MKEQIEEMAKVLRPLTLCYNCRSSLNNDGKRDGGCYTDYECCHNDDILRDCQALYNAGYRKQKEGEWIENPIDNYDGEPSGLYYVCSVCHTDNGFEDKPFCPNCGAQMRGGKNEN